MVEDIIDYGSELGHGIPVSHGSAVGEGCGYRSLDVYILRSSKESGTTKLVIM